MTQSSKADPRRALVTGGASGFGMAIAQSLLSQGAHVAIADIHPGRLQEATQKLDKVKKEEENQSRIIPTGSDTLELQKPHKD